MFGRFKVGNASVAVLGTLALLYIAMIDAVGETPRPSKKSKRPNVLFILADDLG